MTPGHEDIIESFLILAKPFSIVDLLLLAAHIR